MKRLSTLVLAVMLMSLAGFVFAADEVASTPAPEAKKARGPFDAKAMLGRMEKRLEAEKAKETPNKEVIEKMEQRMAVIKELAKLDADKKALLEKDAKADTSAIDAQIKAIMDKMPMRGEGRKGGKKQE